MTPADAIAAFRRAFPFAADAAADRFRRELEQPPVWRWATPTSWRLDRGPVALAECEALADSDRWVWGLYGAPTGDYAATRDDAMRAAERALGLPECEVMR